MADDSGPMRILMVASEAVPYAKAGGLGDVAGVLPAYLRKMGHDARIVMPLYQSINREKYKLQVLIAMMGVPTGRGTMWCRVLTCTDPDGVPVYFIEHHDFFTRPGIYEENGWGYVDNGERFLFLSRAALQICQDLKWSPSVVHCHDWMTAAVPAYLKYTLGNDPYLGYTGSVLTIHNIGEGYQGKAYQSVFTFSGLPPAAFSPKQFEDMGLVNLLKGGIALADIINAVSPTYAREITGSPGGGGLETALQHRIHDLHGILNGVDYRDWNPETDKLIPANYSVDSMGGKAVCKQKLQEKFRLEQRPDLPLIGVVSRMTEQKGLDLVAAAVPTLVERGAQFVLLGSGNRALENAYNALAARYPGRVGCYIGFDNPLAHQIEAGADLFLMPSRWEPCGLNQMYSLRYGTLPVVRATGGLDDTVKNYNMQTSEGTGFKFSELSAVALAGATVWAMDTFYHRKDHWKNLVRRAMMERFNWEDAAKKYEQLYRWAVMKRRHWR